MTRRDMSDLLTQSEDQTTTNTTTITTYDQGAQAGRVLLNLAEREDRRPLSKHDLALIDDAFAQGVGSASFAAFKLSALRAALEGKVKAFDLAHIILERDETGNALLRDQEDVIQLAIRDLDYFWDGRRHDGHGTLPKLVSALIEHGAVVDARDDEGHTALYYCCVNGSCNTFQTLVNAGADIHTTHAKVPSRNIDDPNEATLDDQRSARQVNLLQIALDSDSAGRHCASSYYSSEDSTDENCRSMILYLLRNGLSFDPKDPSALKFLYVACFKGEIDVVKTLLDLGFSILGPAGRSSDIEPVFTSALQAAASGSQRDIVSLLLDRGADPTLQSMCGGEMGRPAEKMTALSAAFRRRGNSPAFGPGGTRLLETCMALVRAGASEQDCELMLRQCTAALNVELTAELLNRGTRIPRYPADAKDPLPYQDATELLQVLESFGIPLDDARLQRHAASEGRLKMLWYLVNSSGPCIPPEELHQLVADVMNRRYFDILRYLIEEYGIGANGLFKRSNSDEMVNMLFVAVEGNHIDIIRFLMQEGADVDCPGLEKPILASFKEQNINRYCLGQTDVQVARLLVTKGGQGTSDGEHGVVPLRQLLDLKHKTEDNSKASNSERKPTTLDTPPEIVDEATPAPLLPDSIIAEYLAAVGQQHQTYTHSRLSGLKMIRLVELEPEPSGSLSSPIRCQIRMTEVLDSGPYEALSYTWEDSAEAVPIVVGDQKLDVTRNLWNALVRLRRRHQKRTLWIDALCIDSRNAEERTQQHRLMRDIYSSAERVICWLGEGSDRSEEVFDFLKDLGPARASDEDRDSDSAESDQSLQLSDSLIEAFNKLTNRPWFYRVWTPQELSFSKKAVLMCGERTEDFASFKRSENGWLPSSQNGICCPLAGVIPSHRWQVIADLLRPMQRRLSSVQQYAALSTARDPRDIVFAIVGMIDLPDFPVDYNDSVEHVYQRFTEAVIRASETAEVLHWLGTSKKRIDDLPSWVPDFSCLRARDGSSKPFSASSCSAQFPSMILPGLEFAGNSLKIKGRSLDKIRFLGSQMPVDSLSREGRSIFNKVLSDWENLAAEMSHVGSSASPLQTFLHAISGGERAEIAWYKIHGNGALSQIDKEPLRDYEDLLHLEEWVGIQEVDEKHDANVGHFLSGVEHTAPGRRFFVSENGAMGLATPQAQQGDSVVFLSGGLLPFVLRARHDGSYELIGDCWWTGLERCADYMFEEGQPPAIEFVLR